MPHTRAADPLLPVATAGEVARLRTTPPPTAAGPAEEGPPGAPRGVTPMMVAAASGDAAAVERLLLHGADPARRDARGRTAAAHARAAGHPHLAARLDTVVDQERTIR